MQRLAERYHNLYLTEKGIKQSSSKAPPPLRTERISSASCNTKKQPQGKHKRPSTAPNSEKSVSNKSEMRYTKSWAKRNYAELCKVGRGKLEKG